MTNSIVSSADSVAPTATQNSFIAEVLRDEFARLGFDKSMTTDDLGVLADEISANPVEVFQAHMLAFVYGSQSPENEPDEPEFSEDELHARLIEFGASARTTVGQLLSFAIENDIDVTELYNAYVSLGVIENGSTNV